MSGDDETWIDPLTTCDACNKPWREHWGFNCDEPYGGRKFKPLMAGNYHPNRNRSWALPEPTWRPYEPCKEER